MSSHRFYNYHTHFMAGHEQMARKLCLQNRTELVDFALAGLLALGIALLTISWQSLRATRRNPVEALRYE